MNTGVTEEFARYDDTDIDTALGTAHHKGAVNMPRRIAIIVLSIVLAVAVLSGGAAWGASAYFEQRVAPGVTFGGQSMTGKTRSELKSTIEKAMDKTYIRVSVNGRTAKASLKEVGLSADVEKTVDALINAKKNSTFLGFFDRINPWSHSSVGITADETDEANLVKWAQEQFITESDRMQPAVVAFNQEKQQFEPVNGKDGTNVDEKSLVEAVRKSLSNVNKTTSVAVETQTEKQTVSDTTAEQTAQQANARLENHITLTNGEGKKVTFDKPTVASWMKYSPDTASGTLQFSIDQDAVAKSVNDSLGGLNQEVVNQVDVVNSQGKLLTTQTKGVRGVVVKDDQNAAITSITQALESSSPATVTVASDTQDFEVTTRTVRYDVPNGDRWVKVDLNTQMAYAYRGTTLVQQFTISSGANEAGKTSDSGTYFVNIKRESQTMRGPGYVTPGVRWISYYNGGEAFHAAPWATNNISSGRPGSHGCINMYPADAKWMYDFLQMGDMVQVVGSTPASPVRAQPQDPAQDQTQQQ